MSIQPIDLQTLLLRLNQVGQEQSSQRDAVIQGQAVTGSEIAQKSEEQERRLDETSTVDEGPEALRDQEGGGRGKPSEEERREQQQEPPEEDLFRDPDLGQNIDISG